MKRNTRIGIFFGVIVALLVVGAIFTVAAFGASIGLGSSGTTKYKISCDGTIDVPAVDTAFTDPKIKTNSCVRDPCNFLSFSIFSDPFAQTGNVQLVVNGVIQDSASWESSFGSDQDYQLTSSCVPNPADATVQVRDSTGTIKDHKTEVFS